MHIYPIDGVMVQDEDDAIDLLKPQHKGLSTGWSAVDPHYLVMK